MALSEEKLLSIKESLRKSAEKAHPGDSEEAKRARNAYIFGTLSKIRKESA